MEGSRRCRPARLKPSSETIVSAPARQRCERDLPVVCRGRAFAAVVRRGVLLTRATLALGPLEVLRVGRHLRAVVPLDAVAPTEILGHDGLLSLVKPGVVGAALAVSAKDRKRLFAPRFRFGRSVAGKPAAALEQPVPAKWVPFPVSSSPGHRNRARTWRPRHRDLPGRFADDRWARAIT